MTAARMIVQEGALAARAIAKLKAVAEMIDEEFEHYLEHIHIEVEGAMEDDDLDSVHGFRADIQSLRSRVSRASDVVFQEIVDMRGGDKDAAMMELEERLAG